MHRHGKFLLSVHLSTQPRWTTLNIIGSDGEFFFMNSLIVDKQLLSCKILHCLYLSLLNRSTTGKQTVAPKVIHSSPL